MIHTITLNTKNTRLRPHLAKSCHFVRAFSRYKKLDSEVTATWVRINEFLMECLPFTDDFARTWQKKADFGHSFTHKNLTQFDGHDWAILNALIWI